MSPLDEATTPAATGGYNFAYLDEQTKRNLVGALRATRKFTPFVMNWLFFSAMVEAALRVMGESDYDLTRVDYAVNMFESWYLGDGVYGDGIGDLPGLESRLDYLQSLGVNALWLSPIFECAYKGDNMHGYDTTDYYAINDRFGQKQDLKALIDDVHSRGMRILFDFVPNHTSTQHAWFTDRAAHPGWYVWAGSPPAGWGYPWGGGSPSDVWRYSGGSYFYSAFGVDSMADLNYENASARAAIQDVERYWLDRGFDGMRVDARCEAGLAEGTWVEVEVDRLWPDVVLRVRRPASAATR